MSKDIRWGIIGTGRIARTFAEGLSFVKDARLIAVGSRSRRTADEFGDKFQVPNRHDSYEALAADDEVDAVYVATPHPLHKANSIMSLRAGKAVLCEKPFTINAAEAREVIQVARENNVFLMEAMWMRFLPHMTEVRKLISDGVIGEVRMVIADFGFRGAWEPQGRLLNPHLGGGALLDVGVYTVSLASMIFGRPSRITGSTHLGKTGVDEQSAMVFSYEGGQLAVLCAAVQTGTPQTAAIMGTDGSIRIHSSWWNLTGMTLTAGGGEPQEIKPPSEGNGFNYEAREVGDCLRAGKLQSDVMPLDETLAIMETMDELRGQWSLRYPME